MSRWINLAGDIWAIIFAASFVSSIIAGVVQRARGKEIWDTPLLPVLIFLHFAWAIPAAIAIAVIGIGTNPIWLTITAILAALGGVSWWFNYRQARR